MKKAGQEDVRCLSLFCLFAFEKVSIVGHVLILKSQFLREWIVMEKKIHKLATPHLWFLFEIEIFILSE